jgi:hypothetical protein
MSVEKTEMIDSAEDKEPIYFTPKRVSLVSDVASILSWVVLVGFISDIVVQVISLQAQLKTQGLALSTLLHESSFFVYLFVNLVIPLLTGLGIFVILQAASVGLNVLLEMDYNSREAKDKAKA